jgi:DNA-binding transcriptional regulator PaaX
MTKTEKILGLLSGAIKDTGFLIEAFLISGYGASFNQIQRTKEKLELKRLRAEETEREKQKFYCLLNKLKREGFVLKTQIGWKITALGKTKLKILRQKSRKKFPKIIKDSTIKIIVFDIPEKERKKRDWLRQMLKNLEFIMLQKSVWIGKTVLTKKFIYNLKKLDILSFVQIFAVSKTGTIKEIT